jgi:hypothetical protein
MFQRNNLDPLTVCEVGCGAGEILRQLSLKTKDTRYFGYELSPQAFELTRSRSTERTAYLLADILKENVRYDCLLCMDVIEHVEDYFGFLRGIKDKAEYKIFHIPLDVNVLSVVRATLVPARKSIGHLQYFTQETAIATLQDCGYEIVDEFFTTWFEELPARTSNAKLLRPLRQLLFKISPRWCVRLISGCSYMVLAK